MSLKKKLILILLVTITFLVLAFLTSFNVFILPPLKEKKLGYVENLREKVKRALDLEKQHIKILCNDWSDWDSMAEYVEQPTEEFEKDGFDEGIFLGDQLDFVLVVDHHGKVIFHRAFRLEKEDISYSNLQIDRRIKKVLETILKKPISIKGIIKTAYEPLLIVANPIVPRPRNAPIPGILVLGKFLDRRMIDRISRYTMDKMDIFLTDSKQIDAFCTCPIKGKKFCFQEEEDKLLTFHPIKCLCGEPVMLLRGVSDSSIFRVLDRHTFSFLSIILFTMILLGLMLYRYIDKFMIGRMRKISTAMNKIEGLDDLSTRIDKDLAKKDEISQLIMDLNATLDKLENEKIFRQNMEKAMLTQGKLASIGRLTSNIAHEINNPLLAISNCVQVIKKNVINKTELLHEAFDISESEIDRIRNIISVLLDFHRMDKEKYTDLDVKELINKSLEVLKWGKKLQTVQVEKNLSDGCFVYGSPIKLEEVFINFLSNAAEAVENVNEHGKIEIRVQHAADKEIVEVHFIDNGPGLSPAVRGSVFEPFVTTKEDNGVGLGLYIAYKIVNIHKGSIVINDGYRAGAHFIIRLPASKNKEV